jgi:hypothetical protein
MSPPAVPEQPVHVLTVADCSALLAACKGASFENRRDEAIIRLFLDTGMRASELIGLRVGVWTGSSPSRSSKAKADGAGPVRSVPAPLTLYAATNAPVHALLAPTSCGWAPCYRTLRPLALIHGVDQTKAVELVTAGLWPQASDGWRVVDFHKTQTTKAQLDGLDHKRHMDRERKARERARKKCSRQAGPTPRTRGSVTRDVQRDLGRDVGRDTKAGQGKAFS